MIDECGSTNNAGDVLVASASCYNTIQGNTIRNRLKFAGTAIGGSGSTIVLGVGASAVNGEYNGMLITIT